MDKLKIKDSAKAATSSLTTSKGLGAKLRQAWRIVTASVLSVSLVMVTMPAQANPVGGTVETGSAVIDQSAPSTTTVTQSSDKAIIDWQSFNIGAGEQTTFVQPNSNSLTLNRVTGGEMSTILGRLSANGRIMLINAAGVLFGAGSKVDVGGLLATTADIQNSDFMAGNYKFKQSTPATGGIINRGEITAKDNGLVALVAPGVENSGVIQANLGKVALAAGKSYTLDLYGDQLINLDASSVVTEKVKDEHGNEMKDGVRNSGSIIADGGKVLLTANAAKEVVDHAINMDGVIQARSVATRNGEVILLGGSEGQVRVSGKIDASGKAANQKGGTIKVLGDDVALVDNAQFDASGDIGGGTILIGGNYQGEGVEQNAVKALVEKDVTINASAITVGDGGKVIVWSDGTTEYYGRIIAKGGAVSGNGGFVETSGKITLKLDPATTYVNASAVNGKAGTWLLDPTDVIIGAAEAPIYMSTLNGGTDVTVNATGDITVDSAITWSTGKTLTLDAGDAIYINAPIKATGDGNFYAIAKGSIFTTAAISTGTGVISLQADSDALNGGDLNIGANLTLGLGQLTLKSDTGNITFTGNTQLNISYAPGATINMTAGNNIQLQGNLTSIGGNVVNINANQITGNNNFSLNGNVVSINSGINIGSSTANISAGHSLTMVGNISAGNVNLTSNSDLNGADSIYLTGNITAANDITLTANGNNKINFFGARTLVAGGDLTLTANSGIFGDNDLSLTGGNVIVNDAITLSSGNLFVNSTTGSTYLGGSVNVNGNVAVFGNYYVYVEGNIVTTGSGNVTLHGNTDGAHLSNRGVFLDGSVNASGDIAITGEWSLVRIGNNITLTSNNNDITLYGGIVNSFGAAAGPYTSNASATGNLTINAGTGDVLIHDVVNNINSFTLQAAQSAVLGQDITTVNNITLNTKVTLTNSVTPGITLTSQSGNVTVNGAEGEGLTVVGGAGNNILTLSNISTASLAVDTGDGTNTVNLTTVTPANTSLTGGTGNDNFILNGVNLTGLTVNGTATNDNDTLNLSAYTSALTVNLNNVLNIESIIGGSNANNTLIGANTANTWTINGGSNQGSVNTTDFTKFANLTGGTLVDTFNIGANGSLTGILAGGGGSDSLVYTNRGAAVNLTLTGPNSGTATGIAGGFASIENLTGSALADIFNIGASGSLSGSINGGAGNDSLRYTSYGSAVAVTLTAANAGNATGITGGFSSISDIRGSASADTLTGNNAANTWNITGANAGNITGGVTFSGFENLVGGTLVDTFKMANSTSSLSGSLNGGSANDVLDYSNYGSAVAVTLTGANAGSATGITGGFSSIENLTGSAVSDTLTGNNAANTWNITGADIGNITGNVAFTGFENLVGGSAVDNFTLGINGSVSGLIDGGAGIDSLTAADEANIWNLTGADSGDVNSNNYIRIENLVGGSAIDDFTLGINGSISGLIDGGAGIDSLTAADETNLWNLTGADSGDVNGNDYIRIENLVGGSAVDTFNMNAGSSVSGTLKGGSANDVLDYSNYGSAVAITLTGVYAGNATGIGGGFSSIENLTGSGASDTLTGNNAANTWDISGVNIGNITGNVGFTGFENLVGGTLADTFNMSTNGSLAGTLNGGSANDSLLYTNYGAVVTVNLTGANSGTATGIAGGFASIENLIGSALADTFSIGINGSVSGLIDGGAGIDSLTAPDTANIWNLTGADSGDVNGNDYIRIENLVGGSAVDDFTLGINGSVSGLIDGGAGIDSLTAADEANIWSLTGADSGNVNGNDYIRIENLVGGSSTDDFTLGINGSVSGLIDGGAGIDSLTAPDTANIWNLTGADSGDVNGNDYIHIENLVGGSAVDDFTLGINGSVSGLIDGGAGIDSLTAPDTANIWNLTGADSGDVNGNDYIHIENIVGGSAVDDFTLGINGSVSGLIDGGAGIDSLTSSSGNDVWNITGADSGDVNGSDFIRIENISGGDGNDTFNLVDDGVITGVLDGGDGTDTLNGADNENVWHITGPYSGDVDGTDFISIENLEGGNNKDVFVIGPTGFIGYVTGDPNEDTLDLREIAGPVYVDLDTPTSGTATGVEGFVSIEKVLLSPATTGPISGILTPTQPDEPIAISDPIMIIIGDDGSKGAGGDITIGGNTGHNEQNYGKQGMGNSSIGSSFECTWDGIAGFETSSILCTLDLGGKYISLVPAQDNHHSKLLAALGGLLAALMLWRYRSKWLGLLGYIKWSKAATVVAVKEEKKRRIRKEVKDAE